MRTRDSSRKLSLHKETLRRLDDTDLQQADGGIPPLTFGMACYTANCLTLGQYCVTSDCILTFRAC
jgi:hypothetical protein